MQPDEPRQLVFPAVLVSVSSQTGRVLNELLMMVFFTFRTESKSGHKERAEGLSPALLTSGQNV